jgi:cytochrome b involved in lipid metabolism
MSAKDQVNVKSADGWRHRMRDWFAFPRPRVVATQRPVTPEELKQHNDIHGSCWIAISGIVYDVTSFISMHPGGAAIFRAVAGKDATAQFQRHHARFTAVEATPELIVGPLVSPAASGAPAPPLPPPRAAATASSSPSSSSTAAVALAGISAGAVAVAPSTTPSVTTPTSGTAAGTDSGAQNGAVSKSESSNTATAAAAVASGSSEADEERRALEELYESLVIPPATTLTLQELGLFLESAGVTREEMAATSQRLAALGRQAGPIDRETFIALF